MNAVNKIRDMNRALWGAIKALPANRPALKVRALKLVDQATAEVSLKMVGWRHTYATGQTAVNLERQIDEIVDRYADKIRKLAA